MLIHPMVERLRGLGLTAMADAFSEMQQSSAADDLSREDWLGLLIDREATARENKRLGRRLTHAKLRQNAVVEDADLRTPRGLDRGLFQKLTTCGWVRDSQHLLTAAQPASASRGWPAPSVTRLAGMVSRYSTAVPLGCLPILYGATIWMRRRRQSGWRFGVAADR